MSDLLTFELCRKAILAWRLMYWATNISLCFCKSDIQTTFIFVTSSVLLLSPVTELTFWKRNGQVFQLFLLKTNSEISFNGCRLLSFLNQYVCPAFSPCKHLHNNGYTPYYIKCLLQATDSDRLTLLFRIYTLSRHVPVTKGILLQALWMTCRVLSKSLFSLLRALSKTSERLAARKPDS